MAEQNTNVNIDSTVDNVTVNTPQEDNLDNQTKKTYSYEEYQAELTRVGTKEKKAGKATGIIEGKTAGRTELMEQLGFDEDGLKAYLEAKERKETDADKLARALKEIENYKSLLDKSITEHTASTAELNIYKNKEILRKNHGVIKDDGEDGINYLMYQINQLVTDEKDFESVAADYLKERPINKQKEEKPAPTKVEFWGGSGKTNKNAKRTINNMLFGN